MLNSCTTMYVTKQDILWSPNSVVHLRSLKITLKLLPSHRCYAILDCPAFCRWLNLFQNLFADPGSIGKHLNYLIVLLVPFFPLVLYISPLIVFVWLPCNISQLSLHYWTLGYPTKCLCFPCSVFIQACTAWPF